MRNYITLWWKILYLDGTIETLRGDYDGLYTFGFAKFHITADNRIEAVKEFKKDEPDIKSIIIYHDIDQVWYDETAKVKRYVLLEDKTIADTKDSPLYHIAQNHLWHNDRPQGTILKQSDNLIDLAEVGDCYETLDKEIYSIDNDFQLHQIHTQKNGKKYIIALWKRNGDIMRRYAVEEV